MGRTHVHHRIVRKITGFPNRFRFRLRGTDGGRNGCARSRQHRESGRDGRTDEPDGELFLRARTNIFHGTSPEKGDCAEGAVNPIVHAREKLPRSLSGGRHCAPSEALSIHSFIS